MVISPFIDEFSRAFLACYFSFVAVFYTVRILVGQKRGNRKLVHAGERYSLTWWNHIVFRWFRVAIWLLCVARYFYPSVDAGLGVINLFYQTPVVIAGMLLLLSGLILVALVHRSMGSEWRSGIDPTGPSSLKTNGCFRFSRNPMFFGVAIGQLGFLLAIPSIFALICFVIGWSVLYRQVMAEEAHLYKLFPQQYPEYKSQVPRWLPLLYKRVG